MDPTLPVDAVQRIKDGEHLKLLSIFHFVVAGFAFLGMAFLILHYLLMSFVMSPEFWKSQKNATPPPKEFLQYFIYFYIFIGAWLMAGGVLNVLSAFFLRQRKHRLFSLIVGGLNCLHIPLGTILGIFTILILSRDSVCQAYEAAAGPKPTDR
jgi:peptidoglycan biosynthesis protein MviN/MurJ (putative lipid II flippase)